MANWYGQCRSNVFGVKGVAALRTALKAFPVSIEEITDHPGFVMLTSDDDSGGWPTVVLDEDDNEIERRPSVILPPHLAEGEVAILMEVGWEKLRFLTGVALAVTWDGRTSRVSIDDIYQRVAGRLKVPRANFADVAYATLPDRARRAANSLLNFAALFWEVRGGRSNFCDGRMVRRVSGSIGALIDGV